MAPKLTFTFEGISRAGRSARLTWTEGEGFDDPDGLAEAMIARADLVCSTVTGPCYTAACDPAVVAWLTAAAAFDEVKRIDDPMGVQALVLEDAAVPDGATP